jgi:hypothetical protein
MDKSLKIDLSLRLARQAEPSQFADQNVADFGGRLTVLLALSDAFDPFTLKLGVNFDAWPRRLGPTNFTAVIGTIALRFPAIVSFHERLDSLAGGARACWTMRVALALPFRQSADQEQRH